MGRPPAGRSGTDDLKARAHGVGRAYLRGPGRAGQAVAIRSRWRRSRSCLAQGRQTGVKRDSSKRL